MVRAPCCEKMGLKKGPWTTEEDHILISYIQSFGHGNWRALPKKAGLLRCGKSCRLRWTNYLRPDIKRGNFSKEEEDTIINLHQALGNRWSAIAAKLPGRTDNEIKNVWHTYLKKRVNPNEMVKPPKRKTRAKFTKKETSITSVLSPSSSVITEDHNNSGSIINDQDQWIDNSSFDYDQVIADIDESFWSDMVMPMQMDTNNNNSDFCFDDHQSLQSFSLSAEDEGKDFWLRVFMEAEELQGLPEI